jgi:hypothetical protein
MNEQAPIASTVASTAASAHRLVFLDGVRGMLLPDLV